jgi:hypothetical protein
LRPSRHPPRATHPETRAQLVDLALQIEVLALELIDFGLQLLDAGPQPGDFVDLALDDGRRHPLGHLPRRPLLAFGRDGAALGLTGRLAAALAVGPGRDVGNAPHVLPLGSRTPDGFVIDANLSRDLPI